MHEKKRNDLAGLGLMFAVPHYQNIYLIELKVKFTMKGLRTRDWLQPVLCLSPLFTFGAAG
jgi:hypothetical protein